MRKSRTKFIKDTLEGVLFTVLIMIAAFLPIDDQTLLVPTFVNAIQAFVAHHWLVLSVLTISTFATYVPMRIIEEQMFAVARTIAQVFLLIYGMYVVGMMFMLFVSISAIIIYVIPLHNTNGFVLELLRISALCASAILVGWYIINPFKAGHSLIYRVLRRYHKK